MYSTAALLYLECGSAVFCTVSWAEQSIVWMCASLYIYMFTLRHKRILWDMNYQCLLLCIQVLSFVVAHFFRSKWLFSTCLSSMNIVRWGFQTFLGRARVAFPSLLTGFVETVALAGMIQKNLCTLGKSKQENMKRSFMCTAWTMLALPHSWITNLCLHSLEQMGVPCACTDSKNCGKAAP